MKTTNELPKTANLVDPRAVVVITVGDVQQVAQQTINRELSSVELMQIQAILEAELDDRTETIQDAICTVLDVQRVPDTAETEDDLRDMVLAALKKSKSLDSHAIMGAFQQALTAFEDETELDVTWSEYHKAMDRFKDDLLERLILIQSFAAETLFILTAEDAQIMARELFGRDLTEDEMHDVKKDVEAGLECWVYVMRAAVTAVLGVES